MKKLFMCLLLLGASSSWAGSINIESAYVRLLPPTQKVTAAFMVINNTGSSDAALVGVQSDISRVSELHTHLNEGGMMQMRQVERIGIPANGETVLEPGGFHIMLIDLENPLILGQIVDLTLNFEDGTSEQIQAEVKKIMAGMHGDKMNHENMVQDAQ